MDAPDAELPIDAGLVERFVAAQHPDLVGSVRHIGNGWDNALFRLGDRLAVRMPRRQAAVPLVLNEQRWLPDIGSLVSVAVPVPVRVGGPGEGYPWPWSIVPWLPGRPAWDDPIDDRDGLATALAEFVLALAVPAPLDAPRNPVRGVPLSSRDDAVRRRLARMPNGADLLPVWEERVALAPWAGAPVWMHGDLHAGNILVHDANTLAAVIDFGDLGAGDPATDIATAWLSFGPTGRQAFRLRLAQAGALDDGTWERARGWALCMGSAMVDVTDGDGPVARIGRHALAAVRALDA